MIKVYKNGQWHDLEGKKVYKDGQWHSIKATDKLYFQNTWHAIGTSNSATKIVCTYRLDSGAYVIVSTTDGMNWSIPLTITGEGHPHIPVYKNGYWYMYKEYTDAESTVSFKIQRSIDLETWQTLYEDSIENGSSISNCFLSADFDCIYNLYPDVTLKWMHSTDGMNFTALSLTAYSIFYLNNIIFFRNNSGIFYTTDRQNAAQLPSEISSYNRSAYLNGTYIFPGAGYGKLYVTTDLSNFTEVVPLDDFAGASNTYNIYAFCGKFIAVGKYDVLTSTDGLSWTTVISTEAVYGYSHAFFTNNKIFISGADCIVIASEAINFTSYALPAGDYLHTILHDIKFINNKYVAIWYKALEAMYDTHFLAYSPDGITWNESIKTGVITDTQLTANVE